MNQAPMRVLTVDYRDREAARHFVESLRQTGFAVIKNHPIPAPLIEGVYREWELFFASPEKHAFTFKPELQAGYFPFRTENAKDVAQKDLKEFYHHYPMRLALPAVARTQTPELYRRMIALGSELLGWIERETPPEVSAQFCEPLTGMIEKSEETLLRVLHYPPLDGTEEVGAVRAAAHEDINLITLLTAATEPGLEVQDLSGAWHKVECDTGTIVINSGDMLKRASDGFYPSTTHRVVNPGGEGSRKPRYSMPLFLHPRRNARLARELTAGDYLDQRLREIGLKK